MWCRFLCLLVLPVDLGGSQSHPVQPARLLETEQPSSPHWTHRQTRHHKTTKVWRQIGTGAHTQTHKHTPTYTKKKNTQTDSDRNSAAHIHFMYKQRVVERSFHFSKCSVNTLYCNASQPDLCAMEWVENTMQTLLNTLVTLYCVHFLPCCIPST